jgi:hypothetical protein
MTWLDEIERIMLRLEPSDKAFDECYDTSEPFLMNALREVARATVPSVKTEVGMAFNARKVGGIVGHKLGYWQTIGGGYKPSSTIPQALPVADGDKSELVEAKIALTNSKTALAELEASFDVMFKKVRNAVNRCIKIVLQQEQSDVREFFAGFSNALSTGSMTKKGVLIGMNNTTLVCYLILILGVETKTIFKSANHFHKCLTLIFGHNVAGTLERTQKLCQRLELSFAKPGRPRKQKKLGKSFSSVS